MRDKLIPLRLNELFCPHHSSCKPSGISSADTSLYGLKSRAHRPVYQPAKLKVSMLAPFAVVS